MVASALNFGFALDDIDFSDRVLHIELISEFDSDEPVRVSDCKRRRKNSDTENVVKVKTLNVSSLVLAANSPFFYKLFKNGMRESQEREVTMRINASEEASLMELLNFMYKNTLNATTVPDLLNVLTIADKYEVTSCMAYCSKLLKEMPLSLESTLLYLELSSCEAVQPLKDAAKKYLIENFKDFTKCEEKAMELPLCALELVLGIDGLKVKSEDDVFDFVLKWGRAHYPKVKERQTVLSKRLAHFIHFSYMSSHKLEEVLDCRDFVRQQVSKLVLEALHLNTGPPYGKVFTSHGLITKHVYEYHPIKVVHVCESVVGGQLESPGPRYVVYLNLNKDECENLFRSKRLNSQPFCVGGRRLYLFAKCCKQEPHYHLGLFVDKVQGSETCTLDFTFAVMNNSSKEFQSKAKYNNVTLLDRGLGILNLLGIPWTELMNDDSNYFINGILHLRAEITLKNSQV